MDIAHCSVWILLRIVIKNLLYCGRLKNDSRQKSGFFESHPKVHHRTMNSVLSVKTLRRKQPTIKIKCSSGIVLCLSHCISMATVSIERPRPRRRETNMTQPCRADTVVEKHLNWGNHVLYSLYWLQVQSREILLDMPLR